MEDVRPRIERSLGWGLLTILFIGCLLVMRPFFSALLWSVVLSFSLWPLHRRLVRVLHGRRTLAATLMALGLIVLILLPFVVAGATLADNVRDLTVAARRWIDSGPPPPPSWLGKIPVVGENAVTEWQDLAADSSKLLAELKGFIEPAGLWLLRSGFALSKGVLELALSILIAFFLLRDGLWFSERLTASINRIAGERGQRLLELAGNTVRGVVYGILGTAFLQAVLLGLALLAVGVPGAPLLALLTFFLCVVPAVGAPLVWIPAALWLFHEGSPGRAIFLIVWGAGVSSIDNFVKPWLISQGSKMPFMLVFFGVLGGVLAFGFIGLFIGPTLLAVGFKLIEEWLSAEPSKPSA